MTLNNTYGHSGESIPIGNNSDIVTINEIAGKVGEILGPEFNSELINKQAILLDMLNLLEQEVKATSDKIGYNYEGQDSNVFKDFDMRIVQDKKVIDSTFKQLLSTYPSLNNLYNSILYLFENIQAKELIGELIFKKYFELLVLEFMDKKNIISKQRLEFNDQFIRFNFIPNRQLALTQIRVSSLFESVTSLLSDLSAEDCELIINEIVKFKVIMLERTFRNFEFEQYRNIILSLFKRLKNTTSLNLLQSKIGILDSEMINNIFPNITNLRHLGISNNKLDKMEFDNLNLLFGFFKNLRSLDISSNKLNVFSPDQLDSLFSNLINLKGLSYNDGRLLGMDERQLGAIFKHLTGLRNINLVGCQLYNMPANKLKIIFGYLRNVTIINLSENILGELEDDVLFAIFGNLINTKIIYFKHNEISPDCKSKLLKILSGRKVELIFN